MLPEFLERDELASAKKAERWAPIVAEALARRTKGSERSPAMPDDYVMKAIPRQMVDAADSAPAQEWLDQLADKQAAGVLDEEFRRLVDG